MKHALLHRGWKSVLAVAAIAAANLVMVAMITGVSYASADSMMMDYSSSSMNIHNYHD